MILAVQMQTGKAWILVHLFRELSGRKTPVWIPTCPGKPDTKTVDKSSSHGKDMENEEKVKLPGKSLMSWKMVLF